MKKIKLTQQDKQELMDKFTKELSEKLEKSGSLPDGVIEIKERVELTKKGVGKVNLLYTPEAFAKQWLLIQSQASEVAWHCTVRREEKEGQDYPDFIIDDVLVYPQYVTGVTVNTDQEEYQQWLYKHDDDTFNRLRVQAHSHVNMGVTPSSVDVEHQRSILEQLTDDISYIFLIFNKKNEFWCKIYDHPSNTMFESADVEIGIYKEEDGEYFGNFISSVPELVRTKTITTSYPTSGTQVDTQKYGKPSGVVSYQTYQGYAGGTTGTSKNKSAGANALPGRNNGYTYAEYNYADDVYDDYVPLKEETKTENKPYKQNENCKYIYTRM